MHRITESRTRPSMHAPHFFSVGVAEACQQGIVNRACWNFLRMVSALLGLATAKVQAKVNPLVPWLPGIGRYLGQKESAGSTAAVKSCHVF